MTIDTNFFDFDGMTKALGNDPFKETSKWASDDRYYVLPKDSNGEGSAIIAFLPDSERHMIQRMCKINTTITKNGKKRFVSEFSPQTINQPCPFHEEWQRLYNEGRTDAARTFARSIRYIVNIKVIKDPAKPENNGKIFLYEISQKMCDKLNQALNPSDSDRALGAERKEIFNPLRGWVMRLIAKKQANGILSYDTSEFVQTKNPIYDSPEAALEDIKKNCYKLSDMIKPESFLPYDELVKKFKWVTFSDIEQPKSVITVKTTSNTAPTSDIQEPVVHQTPAQAQASSELDDLLGDL